MSSRNWSPPESRFWLQVIVSVLRETPTDSRHKIEIDCILSIVVRDLVCYTMVAGRATSSGPVIVKYAVSM